MINHTPSLYEVITFGGLLSIAGFLLVLALITYKKYLELKKGSNELRIKEEDLISNEKENKIDSYQILDFLQKYLDFNIYRLYLQGAMSLLLTLSIGILMYVDIKTAITWQLDVINESKNPTQVLVYLLFRSSALGVIATTVLYFGARMTVASFDQAMRFTKRKMGTVFLEYLYEYHKEKLINQKVTLVQIMTSFEIWNKTVESAFSNIKTEKGDDLLIQNLKELSREIDEDKKGQND